MPLPSTRRHVIGAEAYLRQVAEAHITAVRLHSLSIECGAEWDGMDGYSFTPAQHDEYRRRCAEEGL